MPSPRSLLLVGGLAGLVGCKSKDEPAPTVDKPAPRETKPPVSPACIQETRELLPWLEALNRESRSLEVDSFLQLAAIDRDAAPVIQVVDSAILKGTSVTIYDVNESNHVGGTPGDKATPTAIQERLAATFAQKGQPKDNPAPDDHLRIDVDVAVPWQQVVTVANAARAAGYTQLVFAFTATRSVAAPPGVPATTQTEEELNAARAALKAMETTCPRLGMAFGEPKRITEALVDCNCDVAVEDVRKQTWITTHWHQARRRVSVALTGEGAVVEQPGARPWSEAFAALVAAAPTATLK